MESNRPRQESRVAAALREILASGVAYDDSRLDYVELQVLRLDIREAYEALAELDAKA